MAVYLNDLEEFIGATHSLEEANPDRKIALGFLGGNYAGVLEVTDDNCKRISDFIYPGEVFVDEDTLDDVDNAATDLIATGIIPEKMLATDHDAVFTFEEYRDRVREVAADFDEPVFYSGKFSPGRNYRTYGNADNDKPRRAASMHFPEDAFEARGTDPVESMDMALPGTIVLEGSHLTDDALAVARGEKDAIELADRNEDAMDPDVLYDTLTSLSPGDRVVVNERTRSMTVVSPEETSRRDYSNSETMFLSGNGTEYRVSFAEKYPKMDWSSDTEWITTVDVVGQADPEQQEVVA